MITKKSNVYDQSSHQLFTKFAVMAMARRASRAYLQIKDNSWRQGSGLKAFYLKDWPDLKSSHFKVKPPVESVDDTAGPARPNDDVKDKAVCLGRRWCWWWWWWQSPYSDNDGDHHLVVTMMVMLMVAITWWFSSPNLALHPAIRLPSSSRTGSEIPMNEHGE